MRFVLVTMTAISLTKGKLNELAMKEKQERKEAKKLAKKEKKKKKKQKKDKKDKNENGEKQNDDNNADHHEEGGEAAGGNGTTVSTEQFKSGNATNNKDDKDASKKRKREERKAAKKALRDNVPKVDEHGIAYTKLQIRRMMKRVKRGLPPVPTEEEEQERLRRDAELRREEEAELAGMIYKKDDENGKTKGDDNDDDDSDDDDNDNDNDDPEEKDNQDADANGPEHGQDNSVDQMSKAPTDKADRATMSTSASTTTDGAAPTAKKQKRSKEVPLDYVCQACKNKHKPLHWIYDCPDKVTVRGTNQVSKKQRGIHNPDPKKVHVSGLPFDTKRKDVENLFRSCGGKLVNVKLLTFPDTGRCKGQGFLTFDSVETARKALQLDGTTIENNGETGDKKKGKKKPPTRKELKLKVSTMKNRSQTKK